MMYDDNDERDYMEAKAERELRRDEKRKDKDKRTAKRRHKDGFGGAVRFNINVQSPA